MAGLSGEQESIGPYKGQPDIHGILSQLPGELDSHSKFLESNSFFMPVVGEIADTLHNVQITTRTIFGSPRETIVLSPFIPRGFASSLTKTSPSIISHATGGNFDVASDPTQGLALHVARQRGYRGGLRNFSYGAFLRCVRLQNYPKESGYLNHFEMYGTIDTGSNTPSTNFVIRQITELANSYAHLIARLIDINSPLEISIGHTDIATHILAKDAGIYNTKEERSRTIGATIEKLGIETGRLNSLDVNFKEIQEKMQEYDITNAVRQLEILARILNNEGHRTTIHLDRINGLGHYNGCMFSIHMPDGTDIIDGGAVDWVRKLTQDNKIRTVVSGFGTEFFTRQYLFRYE